MPGFFSPACYRARFDCSSLSRIQVVFLGFCVVTAALTHVPQNYDHENLTDIDFVFLTNVDQYTLHRHDYHIIQLNVPASNKSYAMHLSKPDDLFDPEKLREGQDHNVEELSCVYSGSVFSIKDNIQVGAASLSSCHHEHGFEGLMYLENQHFFVYPSHTNLDSLSHPRRNIRSFRHPPTKPSKYVVKHKVVAPKTAAGSSTTGKPRKDGKQVPPLEFRKAHEEMMKEQESLDDEDDDEEEEEEKDEDDNEKDDDDSGNSIILAEPDCAGMDCISSDFENFAIRTAQKKPTKVKTVARVIELAVFTDEAFYKTWATKYPNDTAKKINQYILTLVNNMNLLYHQPSISNKMNIRLVHVAIHKTNPKGLKATPVGDEYLERFCKFAGKKDAKGAVWDHAMMFTGFNLRDSLGNPGEIGIAFTSAMCLRYWSCSLIEYTKGFETAFTAAHELGHSLGMEHDGEGINKKCDPGKFIMAALADRGQINWSPCSNQNIKNFLASGDPKPKAKDATAIPKCLVKKGSKKSQIRYRTGAFPGQKYNAAQQCQTACKGCKPFTTTAYPFNSICWMLHCQGPPGIVAVHPALEGTRCGSKTGRKKCRNGKCQ